MSFARMADKYANLYREKSPSVGFESEVFG